MENLVLMLKNKDSGFLEDELTIVPVDNEAGLISGAYVAEEDGRLYIHLMLTCAGEVSDGDFERVYDEYGDQNEADESYEIFEAEGFNPSWEIVFPYISERDELEAAINRILNMHIAELNRIMNWGY